MALSRTFCKWDCLYFVAIAGRSGYAHESFHAFLPLLPAVMRALGSLVLLPSIFRENSQACSVRGCMQLGWIPFPLDEDARLRFAALMISNVSFVLSCPLLYRPYAVLCTM